MVFPWLAVLQNVPWVDVIRNAPKVAEGARKLWHRVSGKPPAQHATAASVAAGKAAGMDDLQGMVHEMNAEIAELHAQMLASSALIKSLADQNAELIRKMDSYRRQLSWLGGLSLLSLLAAGIAIIMSLAK